MSSWKVILATLIIFGAGVLTGALIVRHEIEVQAPKHIVHRPPPPPPPIPRDLVERMQRELALTTEQRERIEKLVSESRERVKILWELVGPEMQDERRHLIADIRAQLRADQTEKFEQLMKQGPGPRGFGGGRGRDRGTNGPGSKPQRPPGERN